MTSEVEKDIVEKLKSSKTTEVYDTLVKIRKSYVRNQHKMKNLQKYSVIKLIIPFMEHPKFCNISLSIIADGCLDLSFVNDVIKYDGVKSLVRIMKSCISDDIQNRACRALGNISKFDVGFKVVHHLKPVSNIINFLCETKDSNCQQTAVRTLMILGKCSKTRELIAQENGLIYIAKLLHSSNLQVQTCSVKALANLTQNCSISSARQLIELDFHKVLVEFYPHSEKSVRNHILVSLKNLSTLEEIRSGLVKVGAIKLFTEVLSASESCEMSRVAALALCKCLDHIHMWSHNGIDRSTGLKALLAVLKNKQLQDIHTSVITSLIPLSYEFNTTYILLSLDVLQILIEILDSFVKKYKSLDKCTLKFTCDKDSLSSDSKLSKDNEIDLNEPSYQTLTESDLLSSPEKSNEIYNLHKVMYKWDSSLYGLGSVTSDYSGSCSPNRTCSPPRKYSPASPEFNYDIDVASPSTANTSSGVWSPVSLRDESMQYPVHCWSPVVSTHSNSPVRECEFMEDEENDDSIYDDFSLTGKINSSILTETTQENRLEIPVSNNSSYSDFDSRDVKTVSKFKNKNIPDNYSESMVPRKKFKSDFLKTDDSLQLQNKTLEDINIKKLNSNPSTSSENNAKSCDLSRQSSADKISLNIPESVVTSNESKTKNICNSDDSESFKLNTESANAKKAALTSNDNEKSSDFKLLNENQSTIDHYIIFFIFQISFHIEKKTNSRMADKSFFSVLIDYLCLIHKPSCKVESILSNLIRNRYCLEKLILNGFFCELEEKMTFENSSCTRHSKIKQLYSNLISVCRQEMDSDYGIGTLSRILITSERTGQLHAMSTLSKFVTVKVSLYRLLFEVNGLSLLFDFLSDSDVNTKKKAVKSLCELYQSLSDNQKIDEKCCFEGTCAMETSTKCFYRESFLNVTFSVNGGVKILANREKVCENSDYFRALLQGNFQESNAGLVVIPHISGENLSTIFHFLHGCGNGSYCPYITRIPFSVLLELLSDCEKFLLMSIKAFIEDRLCHRLLPPVIPKIYKQSKMHNSPALAKRTLHSALSIDTSQKNLMWACFQELLSLESTLDMFNDIEQLLKSLLL